MIGCIFGIFLFPMFLRYRGLALALSITIAFLFTLLVTAEEYPQEEYGYITSNEAFDSAYFYALKGNADAAKRRQQPLVLWLQGGPGGSSLFADFLETGPQMIIEADNAKGYDLVPRPHTWTRHATMLYVDNPVGTGFSYTKDPRGFATRDEEIGVALVDFLGKFLTKHPEYLNNDFWIFCESYGGKMTAYFGAELAASISGKRFPYPQLKFKGVEIGDGWVGPIDCMYSYGPYLRSYAQLSPDEADKITKFALYSQSALEQYKGARATMWWRAQQGKISSLTSDVNFYNVLTYENYVPEDAMDKYIQTNLTNTLKQKGILPEGVSYSSQSDMVFEKLKGTFMRDAVAQVSYLLQEGYAVHVLSGQVDLIVNPICADAWIARLEWSELPKFFQQDRVPIKGRNVSSVGGFRRHYKNFNVWTINKAGHMVPTDNPSAAELMFASIVGSTEIPEAELKLPAPIARLVRRRPSKKLYKP